MTRFRTAGLLLLGALALAPMSRGAGNDVPVSKQASSHYESGARHLTTQEPDRYDKAYAEFHAAYADSPSWKILGPLGFAAEMLERDGEAIQAYRGYLDGGGKALKAAEREQFKADLAGLEQGSLVVKLQTQPDGASIVDERMRADGEPVVNRYGPTAGEVELRLRAGHHRIHAELSGYISEVWDFELHPGASSSHVFELRRANVPSETIPLGRPEPFDDRLGGPEDRVAARVFGYSALGLGGVGLALGTVFYLRARERVQEGNTAWDRCLQMQVAACKDEEIASIQEGNELTRSVVSYSAAGALLTTGILLLVYAGPASPPGADELALSPWLTPQQVGVSGRF